MKVRLPNFELRIARYHLDLRCLPLNCEVRKAVTGLHIRERLKDLSSGLLAPIPATAEPSPNNVRRDRSFLAARRMNRKGTRSRSVRWHGWSPSAYWGGAVQGRRPYCQQRPEGARQGGFDAFVVRLRRPLFSPLSL